MAVAIKLSFSLLHTSTISSTNNILSLSCLPMHARPLVADMVRLSLKLKQKLGWKSY